MDEMLDKNKSKYKLFFISNLNRLIYTVQTKLVAPHPYEQQTTFAFLYYIQDCSLLNFAPVVYELVLSC